MVLTGAYNLPGQTQKSTHRSPTRVSADATRQMTVPCFLLGRSFSTDS